MSIGAIGSTTPNYSPQKLEKADNVEQLEKQIETLTKQTKETTGINRTEDKSLSNALNSPRVDLYVKEEIRVSAGTYELGKDKDGNLKIIFDDPLAKNEKHVELVADETDEKNANEVDDEEKIVVNTTISTDVVEAEIEQLKQKSAELEQQIARAEGDNDKQNDLQKQLKQLNDEIKTKDTDSYRRQNATVTTG